MQRLVLFALPILLAACSGGPDDTEDVVDTAMEALEASLLADLATDLPNYKDWGQAEGLEGIQDKTGGPHGNYVQIWYNEAALDDLEGEPVGGRAFKEGYGDAEGTDLKAVTGMTYDAEYGWFYAMWNPAGEARLWGKPGLCMSCHQGVLPGGFQAP